MIAVKPTPIPSPVLSLPPQAPTPMRDHQGHNAAAAQDIQKADAGQARKAVVALMKKAHVA